MLKLLLFIFAIYFIRRFIQLYRVMKRLQEEQLQKQTQQEKPNFHHPPGQVVDAEFKVIK